MFKVGDVVQHKVTKTVSEGTLDEVQLFPPKVSNLS
jgi:hypothetical protein